MSDVSRETLARQAGVSVDTIGNFFRRPTQVGTATTERIMEALAKTGYVNRGAFRNHDDPLSGLTVLHELPRAWNPAEVNPVFAALIGALAQDCARRGAYLRVFENWADHTLPATIPDTRAMRSARRRYADKAAPQLYEILTRDTPRLAGFVVTDPDSSDERLSWFASRGDVAHVILGRPPGRGTPGLAIADIDDRRGFEDLVYHLWERGARRIGHVGFSDDRTGPPRRRRAGVAAALRSLNAGKPLAPDWSVAVDYRPDDVRIVVARLGAWLLKNRWQGVVCDCDRFGGYVATAAANIGWRLSIEVAPGAVVLAGCDDDLVRQIWPIQWATLSFPYQQWASEALSALGEQVRSPGARPAPRLIRPTLVQAQQGVIA